jgi:hypothetical protein
MVKRRWHLGEDRRGNIEENGEDRGAHEEETPPLPHPTYIYHGILIWVVSYLYPDTYHGIFSIPIQKRYNMIPHLW